MVIENDLLRDLQLFFCTFVDDTKLDGRSDNASLIQPNFNRASEWTENNCMLLYAANRTHLHFGRNAYPTLVFPDHNGAAVPILQAHYSKNLGILVNSSLIPAEQVDAMETKFRRMIAFIVRTIKRFTPQLVILLYSAMIRPQLK